MTELSCLRNLDLAFNKIIGSSATAFCKFLQNCKGSLVELSLRHCGLFQDVFPHHLDDFQRGLVKNTELSYLSLACNQLNGTVIDVLRKCFAASPSPSDVSKSSASSTETFSSSTSKTSSSSSSSSSAMPKSRFRSLDLAYNHITSAQLAPLVSDLLIISKQLGRPCLDFLDFSGNFVKLGERNSLLESMRGACIKVNVMVLNYTNVLAEHVAMM